MKKAIVLFTLTLICLAAIGCRGMTCDECEPTTEVCVLGTCALKCTEDAQCVHANGGGWECLPAGYCTEVSPEETYYQPAADGGQITSDGGLNTSDGGTSTDGGVCGRNMTVEDCSIANPIHMACEPPPADQPWSFPPGTFQLDSISGSCEGWFMSCQSSMSILAFMPHNFRMIELLTAEIVQGPRNTGLAAVVRVSGIGIDRTDGGENSYQATTVIGYANLYDGKLIFRNLEVPSWFEYYHEDLITIEVIRTGIPGNESEPAYRGPVQFQFWSEGIKIDGHTGCSSVPFPQKTYVHYFP